MTLNAKDDSYYLLQMIKAGNKNVENNHGNTFRHFMQTAYTAIDYYTHKIKEVK